MCCRLLSNIEPEVIPTQQSLWLAKRGTRASQILGDCIYIAIKMSMLSQLSPKSGYSSLFGHSHDKAHSCAFGSNSFDFNYIISVCQKINRNHSCALSSEKRLWAHIYIRRKHAKFIKKGWKKHNRWIESETNENWRKKREHKKHEYQMKGRKETSRNKAKNTGE